MLQRFQRIQREFGTGTLLRILLLLIGLVGMSLLGIFAFSSWLAALVAAVGLILGFMLRGLIAQGVEYYSRVVSIGLVVYGIVLFLGERLGLDRNLTLLIITLTTVVVFNLQFWSLSDPGVFNSENIRERDPEAERDGPSPEAE